MEKLIIYSGPLTLDATFQLESPLKYAHIYQIVCLCKHFEAQRWGLSCVVAVLLVLLFPPFASLQLST